MSCHFRCCWNSPATAANASNSTVDTRCMASATQLPAMEVQSVLLSTVLTAFERRLRWSRPVNARCLEGPLARPTPQYCNLYADRQTSRQGIEPRSAGLGCAALPSALPRILARLRRSQRACHLGRNKHKRHRYQSLQVQEIKIRIAHVPAHPAWLSGSLCWCCSLQQVFPKLVQSPVPAASTLATDTWLRVNTIYRNIRYGTLAHAGSAATWS